MVDHSQDEDMIPPLDVEDSIGKPPEVSAPDVLMNDCEAGGIRPNLDQHTIELVSESEIQA
jgi:hypothetical protein